MQETFAAIWKTPEKEQLRNPTSSSVEYIRLDIGSHHSKFSSIITTTPTIPMFAYNTSPVYFFDAMSNLQQLQLQQYREQLAAQRPKIIKKVESEEGFQIQIHKASGNFQSYEVKVVRAYGNAKLVNIIIESKADDFSKVFQFSLDDIEVSEIDWEYFERENVLVLNIPKKVKFCADDFANSVLCSLLGVPARCAVAGASPKCQDENKKLLKAQRKEQKKQEKRSKRAEIEAQREAQRDAERLNAMRVAEEARRAQEFREAELQRIQKARQEEMRRAEEARVAELKRREEARAAELRRAEQARKEAARKQLEAAKKAEEQRKKEEARALEAQRQKEEELQKEEEHAKMIRQQQEFLAQLFGSSIFPAGSTSAPFVKVSVPQASANDKPSPSTAQQSSNEDVVMNDDEESDDDVSTDSESIRSDTDTPPTPSKDTLHKQPSLEEVEDEEFVMFRKKFGN